MNEKHHEMILEIAHPSGAEGWYCPTCGRRMLLHLPPNSQVIIVEPGDQFASHSGSVGGVQVVGVHVTESKEEEKELSEGRLRPWMKAMEKLDLNW